MAEPTPAFADLHLLTVLAQTRSYTQAARRLGISKASVSGRIAELERSAGLPLVRRTTRSVGLTPAGQQLVDDTHAAFEGIAQSFASIRDLAGSPRGLVRLTAPVALGRQWIVPTLPPFLRQFPEIRLELDLTDRFVNLQQEGFDLAIRHTQSPPDTHVAWALCPSRSLLVASADYLRRRGRPAHPHELAQQDCLVYLREGGSSWSFEREGARKPERVVVGVRGPLRANNSEALRDAVLGGLGIALLPDFSAAAHLGPRQLVRVLPGWRPLGFFGESIYAIRPWSPQVPRAVQCLVDHLRQALAPGFTV
ncbi:LysR family transcriptional regulator [Ramlibacter solisilvae]|uniref:LysR family transcriptional regulator n=1 Tax=Ramlibacter tataouinensis TaxID=94132 RepID=A0A127JZI0_9BURK|nr:LysR family transcriptional regulator [Ramlibacter tataouinensis]AMO25348.1 LysR family transcriptional regulator [Ramlibacter tataouinensis]